MPLAAVEVKVERSATVETPLNELLPPVASAANSDSDSDGGGSVSLGAEFRKSLLDLRPLSGGSDRSASGRGDSQVPRRKTSQREVITSGADSLRVRKTSRRPTRGRTADERRASLMVRHAGDEGPLVPIGASLLSEFGVDADRLGHTASVLRGGARLGDRYGAGGGGGDGDDDQDDLATRANARIRRASTVPTPHVAPVHGGGFATLAAAEEATAETAAGSAETTATATGGAEGGQTSLWHRSLDRTIAMATRRQRRRDAPAGARTLAQRGRLRSLDGPVWANDASQPCGIVAYEAGKQRLPSVHNHWVANQKQDVSNALAALTTIPDIVVDQSGAGFGVTLSELRKPPKPDDSATTASTLGLAMFSAKHFVSNAMAAKELSKTKQAAQKKATKRSFGMDIMKDIVS